MKTQLQHTHYSNGLTTIDANMYKIITLAAIFALANAQVQQPWLGPFADHVPGQLVPDTPEVAEAKKQHYQAHAEVRAVLPELPFEQKFPNAVAPPQVFPQSVQARSQNYVPQQTYFPGANYVPQVNQIAESRKLAEEIPRSPLGEVPEVYQARLAHLKAYELARAALPVLAEATTLRSAQLPSWLSNNNNVNGGFPVDTPEVAAAKLEHARAYAALG